jgi:hypothetical protein
MHAPSIADLFPPWFHEPTPKSMFSFEDGPDVIMIPYTFERLWNTFHIWDIHIAQRRFLLITITTTLGINNQVNKTMGITTELKISSQVTNFIKQILSFLAYSGSSIVKTVN